MPKYLNASDRALWIPGIGKVEPGGQISAPEGFRNANFTKVVPKKEDPTKDPDKKAV